MAINTTIPLFLQPDEVAKFTTISGNLDVDLITPFIRISQINSVKRMLTPTLYDKMLADFENKVLSGSYLTIYTEFIVPMLSYLSAANIVKFGPYKVENGGVFRRTNSEMQTVEFDEVTKLCENYEGLGNAVELMFTDWIKDNPVPEYENGSCSDVDNSYGFPWYL